MPLPDPNHMVPAKCATEQIVGQSGKGHHMEYKVEQYGCSVKECTYERTLELPTSFARRYWAARGRQR